MKKKSINSTTSKFTVLHQVCNHIPSHAVSEAAREQGSEDHSRTFSHWSHLVSLIHGKLTHAFGLNDICDTLQVQSGPLSTIRGATPPSRNTLSHANRVRPAAIAETVFWKTLEHLRQRSPRFGRRTFPGKLGKLKRSIHLMDSTVIELVAQCMPWAQHRRRKAGSQVLDDHWVKLSSGEMARRIKALVVVDGTEREMTFLTNQMEWSAATVVELYRCRWQIEVFFKQMKQTLKLCDLMSYNANGIRWQIWVAMLVQLVMRYLAWVSQWEHSFVRLYALARSLAWQNRDIVSILKRYGTAGEEYRNTARPEQSIFPGFA